MHIRKLKKVTDVGSCNDEGLQESSKNIISGFRAYIFRKYIFIIICVVISFFVAIYALTIGSYDIGFIESFRVLIDHIMGNISNPTADMIIWNIRLPRVLLGIVVGMGLAAAGAVMQSVLKNPLADPYTTGISSGASFGATIAMTAGISFMSGTNAIVANAFIFSLIPVAIIVLISGLRKVSPTTMILSGIAVMYIFNAFTTVLMLMADPDDLAAVYSWQVGTLGAATWNCIPISVTVTLIGVIILQMFSNKLNVLASGDDSAKSLGVDANKLRIVCLIIVSLVTASIVSFTGIIGFVGLVSPHVVRLFIGSDNKFLIPASAAFGVTLVLISDLLGRTLIAPAVLQVGVVTAFLGGPLFLYLLIKQRKEVW